MDELAAQLDTAAIVALSLLWALLATGLALGIVLIVRLRRRSPIPVLNSASLAWIPWTWRDILFILLALLLAQLTIGLAVIGLAAFPAVPADWSNAMLLVVQALILPVVGLALVRNLLRRHALAWRHVLYPASVRAAQPLLTGTALYLVALPVVFTFSHAAMEWLRAIDYPITQQPVLELLIDPAQSWWIKSLFIVLAVVFAPLVEELLFRGVFLTLLVKYMRIRHACVIVSLGFALLHFHAPSVAPLFLLAMAFSLAYVYTGSLLVPMTMHALFNGVSIALQFALRDVLFRLAP